MTAETVGFRSKIFTSAKLSTLRFLSEVGLRLVSTIILTRLLAPEIYGVFAVVLVYLYLLEMLSDFGIRSLILTREGEIEDDFVRTCWTVSILRGVLISIVSGLIALSISGLQAQEIFAADNPYADPVLPLAIAALGGAAWIVGFQSPVRFLYERNMEFRRAVTADIMVNVIGFIVTVVLAFYLRSIWALVLGAVIRGIFLVILSFVLFQGPRMQLCLNRAHLGVIIDRGKWIIGHSTLTALSQSADRLVLGFVMTSSTFGFYFIARQLVDMVVRFLMSVDAQMGLQVFTHLQKSSVETFRRNYYRYRLFFDALAGLSTGGMVILAPLLVDIIFDDRYSEVASIVQTLIWAAILIGPTLLRSAFSAERRFREMAWVNALSTITLWGGLLMAVFVFDSVSAALYVVALYRLPEAMLYTVWGGDRDWVIIWREFISFGYCLLGILAGFGCLWLWDVLT